MSAICATFLVRAALPRVLSGRGWMTDARASANAAGALCIATARNPSPSQRYNVPNLASHIRTACASIASNTGSSSPGDPLMTWRTSEVAVCCANASARCVRASASSRSRASSCPLSSVTEVRWARIFAFVPGERIRLGRWLFVRLRDKITPSARPVPCRSLSDPLGQQPSTPHKRRDAAYCGNLRTGHPMPAASKLAI